MEEQRVFKICLTGGPCAGKTSALNRVKDYLQQHNYRVFTLPEVATMLFVNGVAFSDLNDAKFQRAFQLGVFNIISQYETSFELFAKQTGHPCVLLCDRGTMDGCAYMSDFDDMLKDLNVDRVEARDQRYDAVIHMVSAAIGAESFYSLDNNAGRSESLQFAKTVDEQLVKAWIGHSKHFIIDNEFTSFQEKIEAVLQRIVTVLRTPSPLGCATPFPSPTQSGPSSSGCNTNTSTRYYDMEETPPLDSLPPDTRIFTITKGYLPLTSAAPQVLLRYIASRSASSDASSTTADSTSTTTHTATSAATSAASSSSSRYLSEVFDLNYSESSSANANAGGGEKWLVAHDKRLSTGAYQALVDQVTRSEVLTEYIFEYHYQIFRIFSSTVHTSTAPHDLTASANRSKVWMTVYTELNKVPDMPPFLSVRGEQLNNVHYM